MRRIDGRTFDRFLAEDLASPLQMNDTYVGLPDDLEGRVSRIHLMESDADANGYAVTFDRPAVHRVICPGANGIATAGDLARFLRHDGTARLAGRRPGAAFRDESLRALPSRSKALNQSLGLFAQRALGLALNDERMGKPGGPPAEHVRARRGRHIHRLGRPGHRIGGGLPSPTDSAAPITTTAVWQRFPRLSGTPAPRPKDTGTHQGRV